MSGENLIPDERHLRTYDEANSEAANPSIPEIYERAEQERAKRERPEGWKRVAVKVYRHAARRTIAEVFEAD